MTTIKATEMKYRRVNFTKREGLCRKARGQSERPNRTEFTAGVNMGKPVKAYGGMRSFSSRLQVWVVNLWARLYLLYFYAKEKRKPNYCFSK